MTTSDSAILIVGTAVTAGVHPTHRLGVTLDGDGETLPALVLHHALEDRGNSIVKVVSDVPRRGPVAAVTTVKTPGFSIDALHRVAAAHHLDGLTQLEIADRRGVSRSTVSRMLSAARAAGIIRVTVVDPQTDELKALAARLSAALGLIGVRLAAGGACAPVGAALAAPLAELLRDASLQPGDSVLVAPGRTVYEAVGTRLTRIGDIVVVPTTGGHDEPSVWYAGNEIARQMADRLGGVPAYLHAPALPAARLHRALLEERSVQVVNARWGTARCAIVGVGAPPLTRTSLPRVFSHDRASLTRAVGDVSSRFVDADGEPVSFAGSERMLAISRDQLARVAVCVALAAGLEKVPGIVGGAAGGWFNHLVTDAATAEAILDAVARRPARTGTSPPGCPPVATKV